MPEPDLTSNQMKCDRVRMTSSADSSSTTTHNVDSSPRLGTEMPVPPSAIRRQVDELTGKKKEKRNRLRRIKNELQDVEEWMELSVPVTDALKSLSEQLFQQELGTVQEKLSIALQDVLEQPVNFRARPDFKNGSAIVEFSIERGEHTEDIQRGQGGSVQNILSVGLRMFALATLGKADHRPFLVLDEQDCWLRPELVPRLVKIVKDAGRELGFQVLMISHHDLTHFDRYADQILRLEPKDGTIEVKPTRLQPFTADTV